MGSDRSADDGFRGAEQSGYEHSICEGWSGVQRLWQSFGLSRQPGPQSPTRNFGCYNPLSPSISSVFVRSPKLLVSGKSFGRPKDIWYTHNPKSGSTHVQWCCAGCNTFSPRPLSGHALLFFPVSGVQKAMHFLHCPMLRSLGSYFSFQFNICYPQAF